MAKLDELRERFRHRPAPPEAADDGTEDGTYATLDVNGMTPEGQLDALTEAAKEMGWSPMRVTCEGGAFVIREDGDNYRLPFVTEDGRAKVVVPYFTAEVAEQIRIKVGVPIPIHVPPSSYSLRLSDFSGCDVGSLQTVLAEAVYNGATYAGWPASTTITVDRDIFKGSWVLFIVAGDENARLEIPEDFWESNDLLEIPSYPPNRIVMSFATAAAAHTHPSASGPVGPPPRTRKMIMIGHQTVLSGVKHDPREIMVAIRDSLNAAGWPSGTRVAMEMEDDGGDGDTSYTVTCRGSTRTAEVAFRRNVDGTTDTVITVPSP